MSTINTLEELFEAVSKIAKKNGCSASAQREFTFYNSESTTRESFFAYLGGIDFESFGASKATPQEAYDALIENVKASGAPKPPAPIPAPKRIPVVEAEGEQEVAHIVSSEDEP